MAFFVSQRVVCVDGRRDIGFGDGYGTEIYPRKGEVYTIREFDHNRVRIGVRLHEIVNAPLNYDVGFEEASFSLSRFRPVRTTSISIFTAMLRKAPAKVRA